MLMNSNHLLRIPIEQKLSRRGWQTYSAGDTLSTIFTAPPSLKHWRLYQAPQRAALSRPHNPRDQSVNGHRNSQQQQERRDKKGRYRRKGAQKEQGKEEAVKSGRSTGLPSNRQLPTENRDAPKQSLRSSGTAEKED